MYRLLKNLSQKVFTNHSRRRGEGDIVVLVNTIGTTVLPEIAKM